MATTALDTQPTSHHIQTRHISLLFPKKQSTQRITRKNQYFAKLLQGTTLACLTVFSQLSWADILSIHPESVQAQAWMIYDPQSDQIIAQHNADTPRAPASLTKMMVGYLTLKAIEDGKIQLQQQVTVPEIVTSVQWDESQMKIQPGQQLTVQELLAGLVIMSANDAALTLASLVAGDVPQFITLMNQTAQQLGMKHTHFSNPSGITMQDHFSSAHDMALLSTAIVTDTPEYLSYSKQPEFRYKDIHHHATNTLLKIDPSVDGLKTGYTHAAGYNLALTAHRTDINTGLDRRLVVVVMGTPSKQARTDEAYKLLNAAFSYTQTRTLNTKIISKANFDIDRIIADIPVKNGRVTTYQVKMPASNAHTLSLLEQPEIQLDMRNFDNASSRFHIDQALIDQLQLTHLGTDTTGQSTLEPLNKPTQFNYQVQLLQSHLNAPISHQAMALANIEVQQFGQTIHEIPVTEEVELQEATWWQKLLVWFEGLFTAWQVDVPKATTYPF